MQHPKLDEEGDAVIFRPPVFQIIIIFLKPGNMGFRFSHNPEFTLHHAQKFVNESGDSPWFLYMGLTLPHPPNARLALTKYPVRCFYCYSNLISMFLCIIEISATPAGPSAFQQQEQVRTHMTKN